MKLKLFFSMMAAAAIMFTGCNKQTELEINYGKTARLEGKVTIFEQEGGTCQPAADVKVYAEVPYSMLTTAANYTDDTDDEEQKSNLQGEKIFETTTDENGVYSFEIPVTDNSGNINIYTERKELNEKFYYGSTNTNFNSPNVNSTIAVNISMFETEEVKPTFPVKGKVQIKTYRDANDQSTTEDIIYKPAAGFEVVAYIQALNREFTTTTNAQGEYSFCLPSGYYFPSEDYNKITIKVPTQTVNGKVYKMSNPQSQTEPNADGEVSDITVEETDE